MTRIRHAAALGLTMMLAAAPAVASDEPDEMMPGRIVLIRNGVLAKFVAKSATFFDLPDANNSPIVEGAKLTISDTNGPESDVYTLAAGPKWKGLGVPAGSKGYKYKGDGTLGDPCKVVLVKQKVVKAVCKGGGVQLATPFFGDVDIILDVGTDTKRYCARFGGNAVRNDASMIKKTNAPAPASCPGSTPTTTSTSTTSSTVGTGITTTTSSTSSTIGGPCCGGMGFSSFVGNGVSGNVCGDIRSFDGSQYSDVVCGGMYVGGGGNSITLPLSTPNNLAFTTALTNCTGQIADVGPTTSTETGTKLKCTDVGCFFGGPLTIPNASATPESACVIITVATPASGTVNCSSGEGHIDLPLDAAIYLTGDSLPLTPGIQPCPLCQGGQVGVQGSGVCNGGLNNGNPCTPANTDVNGVNGMDPTYPTSHDCPPLLNASIGSIPIALALDSGTVSWTGTQAQRPTSITSQGAQTRVFCGYCRDQNTGGFQNPFQQCWENGPVGPVCAAPNDSCQQRNQGAFGPSGQAVKTITVIGSQPGSIVDGLPHDQVLASVFCIPPTFNAAVDAAADLPGPCALSLEGTHKLCATANNCP
jgi:hypothetical protein